ncbi:MAG TPA: M50 family metallopeptidase [Myxococcaceae bacterium]|nr:M50 family metallopeptidase [Myxococcaceae bacterium]
MRYLLAIFLLGLLVALHELGHLFAARLCRMKVERFAVGFGPPLLATRRRGTQYALRAIPFGGYVRVAGMEAAAEGPPGPGSFSSRPRWQRALVLVAGSALNYLCAVALLFTLYAGGRRVPVPGTVGEVTPGSEAARVQLRPGDVVEQVDGRPVREWSDLTGAVAEHAGPQPMVLVVRRGGQALEVRATPRPDEDGALRLGVSQLYAYRQLTRWEAARYAVRHASALVVEELRVTWDLARGRRSATLEGPVGIAQRTAASATAGVDALVALLAAISVALAVFNLLPVPGLDGGRLLLLAIGGVRGKAVDPRVEAVASAAGFLALIALAVWVTVRDARGVRAVAPVVELEDAGALLDAGAAPDAGSPLDAGSDAGT